MTGTEAARPALDKPFRCSLEHQTAVHIGARVGRTGRVFTGQKAKDEGDNSRGGTSSGHTTFLVRGHHRNTTHKNMYHMSKKAYLLSRACGRPSIATRVSVLDAQHASHSDDYQHVQQCNTEAETGGSEGSVTKPKTHSSKQKKSAAYLLVCETATRIDASGFRNPVPTITHQF